jgi:hypothetical protein
MISHDFKGLTAYLPACQVQASKVLNKIIWQIRPNKIQIYNTNLLGAGRPGPGPGQHDSV